MTVSSDASEKGQNAGDPQVHDFFGLNVTGLGPGRVFEMGTPVPTGAVSRKGYPIVNIPLTHMPGWDHLIGVLTLEFGAAKAWMQYPERRNEWIK